jgi:hypothetical protein
MSASKIHMRRPGTAKAAATPRVQGIAGVVHTMPTVVEASEDGKSRTFTVAAGSTLAAPQRLLASDKTDGLNNNEPRLIRFRSTTYPYQVLIREGYSQTRRVRSFGVPGGSEVVPGEAEIIVYGGADASAFAMEGNAVVNAQMEILPYLGHLPVIPSLSDEVHDLAATVTLEPGPWTICGPLTTGWRPGTRERLDILVGTEDAAAGDNVLEFGFFSPIVPTASTPVVSFSVTGERSNIRHPAPHLLYVRHPGGAGDLRNCIVTWSRTY